MNTTKKSSVKTIFILASLVIAGLIALPALASTPIENTPDLVRFFGRFHPVILHMPIGIIVLIATMEGLSLLPFVKVRFNTTLPMLFGALSAIAAVILGFLLYQGGGYTGELAERHLWGGTIVAVMAVAAFAVKFWVDSRDGRGNLFFQLLVFATGGVMGFASHDGASMTHGKDYLTQYMPDPMKKIVGVKTKAEMDAEKAAIAAIPVSERVVYESTIVPILEAKCYSCHGEEKIRGKLRLDSFAAIMKGGSEGPSVVPGDLEESTLVARIHLPEDDDEHMPPEGKPQVDPHELELLSWWVEKGASESATFGSLGADEKIEELLAKLVSPEELERLEKEKAEAEAKRIAEAKVKKAALLKAMDSVSLEFPGSLNFLSEKSNDLEFSAVRMRSKFTNDDLEKLVPVAEGIVLLDLSATSITDEAAETLAKFKNLKNLKLGETEMSDAVMPYLSKLNSLESLNIYGTQVSDEGIASFNDHLKLERIYVWGSKVSDEGIAAFQKAKPKVNILGASQ